MYHQKWTIFLGWPYIGGPYKREALYDLISVTFEVLSSAVCTCYCHFLCMLRTNGSQFGLQAHLSLDKDKTPSTPFFGQG